MIDNFNIRRIKNKIYVTVEKSPDTDVTKRSRIDNSDIGGERIGIFTNQDMVNKNKIICNLHDEGKDRIFYPRKKHMISKYTARHKWHSQIINSMLSKEAVWLGPCYMVNGEIGDMQLYVSGTIEKGESFEDAAQREIKEEIGLETKFMKKIKSFKKDAWYYALV